MYAIRFSSRSARELKALPQDPRESILEEIERLSIDPRPLSARKLSGRLTGRYRIRIGAYRVLYAIYDSDRTVLVTKVGHRKSIYR